MSGPERGLYERLITEALEEQLGTLGDRLEARRSELHEAEAADRLALHLARVVERAIASLGRTDRVAQATALARQLVDVIIDATEANTLGPERPVSPAHVLRGVVGKLPDGSPEAIPAPLIPLLDTTLLTNAPGEPRVGNQVVAEIHSADRIDVVMAFIRRSGISPMLDALHAHCRAGRELRVLTTTYTGSTEAKALDQLRDLGADVRVSYDETTTRLHAKAWLFHRHSGFSTAYIGSSNLTHSAQVNGLEWNVRVSSARNLSVIDKVAAVFESYWNGGDFVPYDREQFIARTDAERAGAPQFTMSPIELRPEPFQERLLEQIALSRGRGHHRNLLVSATGTGKTVMAALDYVASPRGAAARAPSVCRAPRRDPHAEPRHLPSCASRPRLRRVVGRPRAASALRARLRINPEPECLRARQPRPDSLRRRDRRRVPPRCGAVLPRDCSITCGPSSCSDSPPRPSAATGCRCSTGSMTASRPSCACGTPSISTDSCPFAYFGVHDGLDLRDIPWRRGQRLRRRESFQPVHRQRRLGSARRERGRVAASTIQRGCAHSDSA